MSCNGGDHHLGLTMMCPASLPLSSPIEKYSKKVYTIDLLIILIVVHCIILLVGLWLIHKDRTCEMVPPIGIFNNIHK